MINIWNLTPNLHTNSHFKMWAEKWTIMQEASGSSTAPNADDSHNHYEIKLQQIISKRNTYWHSTPQNSAHTKDSEGVQRTNAKYHMVSLSTEQGRIVCVRACVVCVCVRLQLYNTWYVSNNELSMRTRTKLVRNTSSNPEVSALIPRLASNRTERMCKRNGSNWTPTLRF